MSLQAVRNLSSLTLLPLALLLAVPLPAASQTFEERAQVTAIEVPVNVVDRDGKPVRGLTAANFEVYDGGDLQKLSAFEVVDLAALDKEPQPFTQELESGARRHFLLMFDLSFASPTSILKARMAARDFVLSSLHPTDLAAVATFSLEYGPKLVITFTPDRAQLARAIDTLGARRVIDARRTDPLRFLIEPNLGDDSSLPGGPGSAIELGTQRDQAVLEYLNALSNMAERSERTFEVGRISSYSRALGDVAKRLNAVQGRKHVLFFSEGFDSRLLLGRETTDLDTETDNQNIARGQNWMVDNDARYGNTGLQNDVNKMLEEFRRADCVIQAVDVGGLRASGDQRPRASGQEALFYMANETGGELFKDANNLREPLERVLERTSVTYLLTFERSDLKTDGSYHKLRVKLKDLPNGTRASHRTGYYAPRPFQDLDPLEKSLLASDGIASAAPRRDLDMNVLVAPFRANEQTAYVPVIIEVKGPSLLAGHPGDKMDVEFFAYVSDAKNQMRGFFNQRVGFEMSKAKRALQETGVKYYGHFELPPGQYRVRVLTRNAQTGRTAVDSVPLDIPSYEASEPILLPPFFMEENQRWIMVRERDGDDEPRATIVYPFTVAGEPYVPAAKPVLKRHERARLCVVAYNLGKGDVSLSGKVLSADGKDSLAGRLAMVERTATGIEGLDKLIATFDPTGLNAGDYVLHVAVTDPKTGHKETNSLPFHVLH
ncbi:MAG TPA: VWA domain-containing protein [Thermoanaerobaculia bacterium]|nr:VWA domain-containing protein [Thermoanaerobaculia bacterium]